MAPSMAKEPPEFSGDDLEAREATTKSVGNREGTANETVSAQGGTAAHNNKDILRHGVVEAADLFLLGPRNGQGAQT